ncbi:helix-turn-helix domain-containing protein [Sedimenticola selenatireducens]|uniref:helix-turn-helix domain-containing protein n=1 Tax=Sedimenticola selenatireducens TaxID=191960 RepID=UPI00068610B3|nr:helix-turn-helix domain-containing protein [Sedimenticola selenatireducens]
MNPTHQIPTIEIYGEQAKSLTPDLLHCEPLITRSRKHQFKIRPHRHPGLTQIFYLKRGHGRANLDGDPTTLKAPCLIVISEMCVHDFTWSEDVEGSVLSISNLILDKLEDTLAKEQLAMKTTMIMTIRHSQRELEGILELLSHEYSHPPEDSRAYALIFLVQLLGIWLERNAPSIVDTVNLQNRGAEYFSRFSHFINRDFMKQRTVESYAEELGITASYLNNLCRQMVNKNALQLIHERVLLEAKRNLIYTVQSVSQISYGLGFNDPAYFSRFFKRLTGQPPKAFRHAVNKIGEQSLFRQQH